MAKMQTIYFILKYQKDMHIEVLGISEGHGWNNDNVSF
jgi:hypothetical protein